MERNFSDLVEFAPDALVFIDREGRIVLVSAQTEILFGYTRDELVGQAVEILVPDRFRDIHVRFRNSFVRDPKLRPMGSRSGLNCRRRDGSEFVSDISLSPIGTGADMLLCAAVRDITERKRAEDEIEANLHIQSALSAILQVSLEPVPLQQQLQRILEHLFSIPWISLQAKGSIFLLDPATQKLKMTVQRGLPDEVIATCHEVPVGACLCGRAAAVGQTIFAGSLDHRHEYRFPETKPHGHYCVPIQSNDRLYGVINLYVDEGHLRRTEDETFLSSVARVLAGMIRRDESEQALKQSEERFDLAVRGTDAGIWDWDLVKDKVYFSPRWKSMLGYSADEITDELREWESRLHPEDHARALATINDYLDGKTEDYELAHRLRHRNGSYRWILARGAAVRDQAGKPYRMVGSNLDITELREAEKALKENEFQMIAAKRIQEHLFPAAPPRIPGFEIAGASFPAEAAGGDSFDYIPLPDGSLCVAIGDVTGHGFASALLMASTHAYLRSLAPAYNDLGTVMASANKALHRETEDDRFVTLLLAHLDPVRHVFRYCSAGHPTGYVLDASGEIKSALESTGIPLGLFPEARFPVGEPAFLSSGDTVLLLTDGILEAQSQDETLFGVERTLAVVRENREKSASEIIEALYRATLEFSHTVNPADDVTVIVIKVE